MAWPQVVAWVEQEERGGGEVGSRLEAEIDARGVLSVGDGDSLLGARRGVRLDVAGGGDQPDLVRAGGQPGEGVVAAAIGHGDRIGRRDRQGPALKSDATLGAGEQQSPGAVGVGAVDIGVRLVEELLGDVRAGDVGTGRVGDRGRGVHGERAVECLTRIEQERDGEVPIDLCGRADDAHIDRVGVGVGQVHRHGQVRDARREALDRQRRPERGTDERNRAGLRPHGGGPGQCGHVLVLMVVVQVQEDVLTPYSGITRRQHAGAGLVQLDGAGDRRREEDIVLEPLERRPGRESTPGKLASAPAGSPCRASGR